MRMLTSTAFTGAVALVAATAAGAVTISLDEFTTPFDPNPLTTSGATVTSMTTVVSDGNSFDRTTTLTADRNLNGPPSQASVRTDEGTAVFSNDTGVSSILSFSYDVGSTIADARTGADVGTFRILEIFADRPRTYSLFVNGDLADSSEQLVDTEVGFSQELMFNFDAASLTGDDTFEIRIDAGVDGVSFGDALDLELSFFDIMFEDMVDVPAPGALGLLGLGLLGMGIARRKTA